MSCQDGKKYSPNKNTEYATARLSSCRIKLADVIFYQKSLVNLSVIRLKQILILLFSENLVLNSAFIIIIIYTPELMNTFQFSYYSTIFFTGAKYNIINIKSM